MVRCPGSQPMHAFFPKSRSISSAPCSRHVSLRLSGTERIRFQGCITHSLLDLIARLLICYLLKSYYVLRSLKLCLKLLKIVFSDPHVSPNSSLCTAHNILSNIWFQHASINNCSSIFNRSLKLNTGTSFPPRV